jgi:hypothetical protein
MGLSFIILCLTGCSSVQIQRTATSETFTWRSLKDAEVLLLPVVTEDNHMFVPVSTDSVVPIVEKHFRRSTLVLDVPRTDPEHGGTDGTGYWAIVREAGRSPYRREHVMETIQALLGEREEDFALLVRTIDLVLDRETWDEEDEEGTEKEYWQSTADVTIGVYLIDLSDGSLAWFAEGSKKVSKKNHVTRWEDAEGNFFLNLLHNVFIVPLEGAVSGEKEGYPDYPTAEATYGTLDKLLDGMPH